ncbi:hypothetical protein AQF52_8026 [Streptomyces venezuelae]|nr:hypothetical protein AQF52_8026 [Streptomyces venezuelae]CUM35621.1 hypothetical protein BN2537_207 [Streptomyces venezuelae]
MKHKRTTLTMLAAAAVLTTAGAAWYTTLDTPAGEGPPSGAHGLCLPTTETDEDKAGYAHTIALVSVDRTVEYREESPDAGGALVSAVTTLQPLKGTPPKRMTIGQSVLQTGSGYARTKPAYLPLEPGHRGGRRPGQGLRRRLGLVRDRRRQRSGRGHRTLDPRGRPPNRTAPRPRLHRRCHHPPTGQVGARRGTPSPAPCAAKAKESRPYASVQWSARCSMLIDSPARSWPRRARQGCWRALRLRLRAKLRQEGSHKIKDLRTSCALHCRDSCGGHQGPSQLRLSA